MALPVDSLTLELKPIEQTSEFIGAVKSRKATTIQPQVEGFITNIAVKSGDQVKPGDVLMEIDSRTQEAAAASLDSVRAARMNDVTFARQEEQRAKALLDSGAGSQQDYDRAVNARKAAEAQLKTVEEQIRQQKTELAYYQVTAPVGGTIGDIPVRKGDRVTRQTALTTIDDNTGMELYLNVPVQRAGDLKVGLPVRLVSDTGEVLASNSINFIAPSVDDATQTVLVKTGLGGSTRWRADQLVRVRVIWSTTPGLAVPVVSALRVNGQYFIYVVEPGVGPMAGVTVAHMRPVTLGPVVGNDYVVLGGLKPGETVITGGIQKLGDGAPVRAGGPPRGAGPGPAGGRDGRGGR